MSSPSKSPLMTPEALNEIVTLYVGSERKKYIVHKKILCDQSEFFDAGFNKYFKEAVDGEMYLPKEDPDTVAALIEYIYRGTFPYTGKKTTYPMRKLYCLAEKICMPLFMDQLMDEIMETQMEKRIKSFRPGVIQWIYKKTHSTSKLRLYASATLAFRIHMEVKNKQKESKGYLSLIDSCPELFSDVFRVICVHRASLVDFNGPVEGVRDAFGPCGFHVHSPDGICYRKARESKTI